MQDPLPVEPVAGPVDATVALPGSKSITNRALICAALAEGTSVLRGVLHADDTVAMVEALRALGVEVTGTGHAELTVSGPPRRCATVDARQSGTTARFLLPLLALLDGVSTLDGDPQLRDRPMGPTFEALRDAGARVEELGGDGSLPVTVAGPLRAASLELPGDVSSQFLSGLLLAGPATPEGLQVTLTTELVSRPYVEMTVSVVEAFGGLVDHDVVGGRESWHVAPGGYRPTTYGIEPDASAASYVFAAAVLTGGRVTVPGLSRSALQGDVAFADVLGRMGAEVTWHDDAVTVAAGARLVGIDVDMEPISDTVPTLAAMAALAEGPTTIRGVGFIRAKESDRIAGPVAELRRCGADAEATDDGMVIRPAPLRPATFETYRDHRMAMAFSLLGLVAPGMEIRDPGCVAKTFPGWWDLLDQLRTGSLPAARGPAGGAG
ncbi:MAG TPA: 3-phosphoshikimate 1-carboxyvinyltransferase [Acidimicrobiales bacterium]|nr:3-phosphoshikimate 1-carboxyvinyltransferase [Acidimicrobiales bacterium]